MKYIGPYIGGPSAPWADEDDLYPEGDSISLRIDSTASALAKALEMRALKMRSSPTVGLILDEIRAQISAACATNNFTAIGELTDMMMEMQELAFRIQASSGSTEENEVSVSRAWDEPDSVTSSDDDSL